MTIQDCSAPAPAGRSQARLMTVGELSRRTGVPVKTLREYTDTGLIYTAGRSPANYRLYTTDALWCARWIGELRGLGLTVAEIRDTARECLDRADRSVGPRLARLLDRSRERAQRRIAEQQQVLARIDAFERDHGADLARAGDLRWAGDPGAPASIRSAFCNQVHFFVIPGAAKDWLAEHPGATVMPVAGAHELGRPLAEALLSAGPPASCC